MKTILLFINLFGLSLSAMATPVATTTATQTVNGQSVVVITAAAASTPYYRMSWMVVVREGADVNVFKGLVFSTGVTKDIDDLYCATTYAEIQAKATALGIAKIPADPNAGR